MSIAVSAVVVPSRRLRLLAAGFALANLGAAAAVGCWGREQVALAPLCVLFFLVAGLCLLHTAAHKVKTLRIDISGPGQVRLTVQQDLRTSEAEGEPVAMPVTLLPGSTVWPQLMLLLLRAEGGALTVLPLLRDSVTPQQFRALVVAVRAAGAHDTGMAHPGAPYRPFVGTHKIL